MWIRPKKSMASIHDGLYDQTQTHSMQPIWSSLTQLFIPWTLIITIDAMWASVEKIRKENVWGHESQSRPYIYIYIQIVVSIRYFLIILESRIIFLTVKLKWMAEIDLNIKKTKGKNENLKGKKNFAARQTTKKKTIFLPILTQKRLFFLLIFFLFFLLFSSVSLSLSETISRLLFSLELWLSVSILNFTSPLAPITSYSHFSRK